MVTLKEAAKKYIHGNNKTAVFALTTQCNCRCQMCDIHRKKPELITLEDAQQILDTLVQNKFLVVYFTGGEPTLHPRIVDIVKYANDRGLVATMTTNGTANHDLLYQLKEAGLYLLSVSLDHWDPEICEQLRQHRKIMDKQVQTIQYLKKIGLKTYALAYLNPYLVDDGVENLMSYVNDVLKVPFGFCYPTTSNINSYSLGGILSDKQISHKLDLSVKTILHSKTNGASIANLWVYLQDILTFTDQKKPHFFCRGGEDVVYIDWRGDVFPCFLKPKIFNILNDTPKFLSNVKCDDCLINCFREPSVLPHFLSAPHLLALEILYSRSDRWVYG
jgi:MoaA/NifB/PqqE/SkfB family radical SAM enzyme